MLELGAVDLEELAMALEDQENYDHCWLVDPTTGQLSFWTSDLGIDGENPVELDELDLIAIQPVPSYVWYQDMVDFAEGISDPVAGQRLIHALRGKGAFRRFKDQFHRSRPELLSAWQALREVRARRRAVEWLLDEGLISSDDAHTWVVGHPDPELP
jgi:hypothetical protein